MSDELHLHIHLIVETAPPSDSGQPDPIQQQILDRLTMMEFTMSDTSAALAGLTDAIAAATGRVNADTAHLQDLLEQALATDTANEAEIARLRSEASTTIDSINAATAQLGSIDPVADFPTPTDGGTTTDPGTTDPGTPPADDGTTVDTGDGTSPTGDTGTDQAPATDAGDVGDVPASDVPAPGADPADTATSSGL